MRSSPSRPAAGGALPVALTLLATLTVATPITAAPADPDENRFVAPASPFARAPLEDQAPLADFLLPHGDGVGGIPGALTFFDLAQARSAGDMPPLGLGIAQQALPVAMIADGKVPKSGTPYALSERLTTFGLPLAQSLDVAVDADGRPALGVDGASMFQFETLDRWPNGAARWVLGHALVDVGTGQPTSFSVREGPGQSGQADLASEVGNGVLLDTGPMQIGVLESGFNLFDSVVVDGKMLIVPGSSVGITGTAIDGQLLSLQPTGGLEVEWNGPAYASLRLDGTMLTASGEAVIDVTCRIAVARNSREVEVALTARNASIDRAGHNRLGSLGALLRVQTGGNTSSTWAGPDGELTLDLAPQDRVAAYMAYVESNTFDVTGTGPSYLPHIPKVTHDTFEQEGWWLRKNGQTIVQTGRGSYPQHGWVDLTGTGGGVTTSYRRMPYFWPGSFDVTGDGWLAVGAFSHYNPAGFTFTWRQHESRTMSFAFHTGPAVAPEQTAIRLDNPAPSRALDYAWYRDSGVFPYLLATVAEQNEFYDLLGVDHQIDLNNWELQITRFLPAGSGGGHNNHSIIEKWLVDEYLRHGHAGQYQRGLDLALYKSEWQIQRSDDFDDADDPGATDDTVPHTKNIQADKDHRYREGITYAWYLTGDTRYLDALRDEVEVLHGLSKTAHERAEYQTIRALAVMARFFDDEPSTHAALIETLRDHLHYLMLPLQDIHSEDEGFGWEDFPGQGNRAYFVNSEQQNSVKPPGEHYMSRGFVSATLGPTAFHNAIIALGLPDADGLLSARRLRDLATYTREELFPWHPDPAQRHLVYTYAVTLQEVLEFSTSDHHTILLAMADAYWITGSDEFLVRGLHQIEGLIARGHLDQLDSRLDVQHYIATVMLWYHAAVG